MLGSILGRHCQKGDIVVDLGCGTGELTLRLAALGYEIIGVDASADMLCVLREKLSPELAGRVLLLQQDLAQLDLYGTIRAAVASFDTFNHLPPEALRTAVSRIALFLEPGGLLVFDANTPYKHEKVLADNCFEVEGEGGLLCMWQNSYDSVRRATHIEVEVQKRGRVLLCEDFYEYAYTAAEWEQLLAEHSFVVEELRDGESFGELTPVSQRFLFTAQKLGGKSSGQV